MSQSLPPGLSTAHLGETSINSSPVLNLERLRRRCLGNAELVTRILAKLEPILDQETAQLRRAWQARDWDSLAKTAHRLKGTSANVAADPMCRLVADLEIAARNQTADRTEQLLDRIEQEHQELTNALRQLRVD